MSITRTPLKMLFLSFIMESRIRKHLYLIDWYLAVLALTPLRLLTLVFMPGGWARGQELGYI